MAASTERLGVSKLEFYFSSHGWLFREQMIHDYGIDAHIEIVNDAYPTGDLIAIQIKSGMSFFSEETEEAYIFRTEDKHISYWSNHSLPVILVLYNPDADVLLWQVINETTVVSTGKGWKIEVPKSNVLNENSLRELSTLTQPEPYIQKLNKMKFDRHWMHKITEGYDVFVEFDDWVNKSLSRYQISLISEDEVQDWPMTFSPGMSIEEALEFFIPWADFEMDIESHREASESQWSAECYMTYDKEDDQTIYSQSFESWYNEPDGIVPFQQDGEIASYRLQLSLNEIGKAFLKIDEFLSEKSEFQGRTFTFNDLEW